MVTLRLKEEQMSAALKRLLLLVCLPPGTSLEKLPASMAMSTLRLDDGLSYSNVMLFMYKPCFSDKLCMKRVIEYDLSYIRMLLLKRIRLNFKKQILILS